MPGEDHRDSQYCREPAGNESGVGVVPMDNVWHPSGILEMGKHIVGKEIRRTIKYDNLKKTFLVATNGADQPGIFPNFESAQKAMADLSGIPLIPISALSRGNNYYAQIKVKIDRVRLPFNMEYVLFFVSLWDFETPLYKVRFSY